VTLGSEDERSLCSVSCDPARNEETCGPGLVCTAIGRSVAACRPIGSGVASEECDLLSDCGPDLFCTENATGVEVCFIQCGPGLPACAAPTECVVPTDEGAVVAEPDEFGICADLV
jgi:hypothetical protein